MRAPQGATAVLALASLMSPVSIADAVDWGECAPADRAGLLESALLWEVAATARYADAPVTCIVVGLSRYDANLGRYNEVDPPAVVVAKVARAAKLRVVPVSQSAECPGAPQTHVSEPRCAGMRGIVGTRLKDHCPLMFKKSGRRWIDITFNVCA